MVRHEIKLRKQLFDESALQRHRNYSLLLQQHERDQRRRKTRRIFIYSLLFAIVTVLLLVIASFILVKWERDRELKKKPGSNQTEQISH